MPARVCEGCEVNWPNVGEFTECPVCDESTEYIYARNADFATEEARAYAREHRLRRDAARTAASPAHANRVERYLALGFSEVDAQVLALSTRVHVDSLGRRWVRHVNHLDVAAALASGCSHALALEIFR